LAAKTKRQTKPKTKTAKKVKRPKPQSAMPEPVPGLAKPAQRALLAAGITEIAHFAKIAESQLAGLHGMGPNALDKIKTFLKKHGVILSGAPPLTAKPGAKKKQKKRR
jgi:hypothetical protein